MYTRGLQPFLIQEPQNGWSQVTKNLEVGGIVDSVLEGQKAEVQKCICGDDSTL